MNDDLKAYVDGELPPDAADRLRTRLEADPELALQGEEFRRLSMALRGLPEPMSVGQAATLEALARRRPLWRGWTLALAGCAAVLAVVSTLPSRAPAASAVQPAVFDQRRGMEVPEERSLSEDKALSGAKASSGGMSFKAPIVKEAPEPHKKAVEPPRRHPKVGGASPD